MLLIYTTKVSYSTQRKFEVTLLRSLHPDRGTLHAPTHARVLPDSYAFANVHLCIYVCVGREPFFVIGTSRLTCNTHTERLGAPKTYDNSHTPTLFENHVENVGVHELQVR